MNDVDFREHRRRRIRSSTLTFRFRHHDDYDSDIDDYKKRETTLMLTVHLNDRPGSAVYQEFDGLNGTGNKVPPVGAVVYASDNPAVAVVDPATGALVYVSAGTAVISASDNGNFPASDTLTVVASVAQSATLTLTAGV
jgi:uncharacterized protein YjdB